MKIPTPKFSYFEGTATAELLIFNIIYTLIRSFPDGSDGKESSCNAGDPGSIVGSGISLEKGMVIHSSGQRSLASYSLWGHKELNTTERLIHMRVHTQTLTMCW